MSEISDAIQAKCLAFGDRIIKLNDYLLAQAVAAHENYKKSKLQKKGRQTSSILHQPSSISVAAVPVYLQSVSNLCNQLLRAGTSIGANNAEASSAISKADFKSKSYIALKEARECLYWIDLLHRNGYLDDKQYQSIYNDCEELVKILVARCKKLNED
jgi:four helix bundle protein